MTAKTYGNEILNENSDHIHANSLSSGLIHR